MRRPDSLSRGVPDPGSSSGNAAGARTSDGGAAGSPAPPAPAPVEPQPTVSHAVERLHRILTGRGFRLEPDARARIIAILLHREAQHDLDALLVLAVISHESRFDPGARGPSGSLGLMQVRPFVGEDVARRIGIPWEGPETLLDPVANVRIGSSYLGRMLDRFQDRDLALAAYNMGPTRVGRWLRRGRVPHPAYVTKVLDQYDALLRSVEPDGLRGAGESPPVSTRR